MTTFTQVDFKGRQVEFRTLGKSGLRISAVSFGAGPISGLMVGTDKTSQRQTVQRALQSGINWFDTAATYGDGASERSLGPALAECESRPSPRG